MSDHQPPLRSAALRAAAPVAARAIVGTRRLVLADALVGITLTLVLAVPLASTISIGLWGDQLAGEPTGNPDDGIGVFLAWLGMSLLALVLAALLAIAALVLDILVLIRSLELTTGRLGAVVRGGRRLLFALLGACGIATTPVLGLLCLVPAPVLGPGTATDSVLLVLLGLAFVAPIMCRLLMIAFSHELAIVAVARGPSGRWPHGGGGASAHPEATRGASLASRSPGKR